MDQRLDTLKNMAPDINDVHLSLLLIFWFPLYIDHILLILLLLHNITGTLIDTKVN